MNVELGDSLKSAFVDQSSQVQSELSTLTNAVNSLLSSWMGNSKSTFENEWQPWVNQVNSLITQMDEIQQRLGVTIEAFRTADVF
jgi:WXG100 family type VII secretion target